jgi:hypothetical protein
MARNRTYTKNGFDIIAQVDNSGEQVTANILYKPYGADEYIEIGTIYETETASCGTTRNTNSWSHERCKSPMWKHSWYEAAIKLYGEWREEV